MRRIHAMDSPEWDPAPAFGGRVTLPPPMAPRPALRVAAVQDENGRMSGALAALLRQLCREAGDRLAYDPRLTGREARGRIAVLRTELALRRLPPHTD